MNFTSVRLLHLIRPDVKSEIVLKIQKHLTGSEDADFLDPEIQFLREEANVKFSFTANDYLCFYSIEVGNAGYGTTQIQAFANLLRRRGIIEDDHLDVFKLEEFLKISIPSP